MTCINNKQVYIFHINLWTLSLKITNGSDIEAKAEAS